MTEQTPAANGQITIEANEDITLTLKGSTVVFIAQAMEEMPMPRKVYAQVSEDFKAALNKAKAP